MAMDLNAMFEKQQSLDLNDEDLEDELNAILSGKNIGAKTSTSQLRSGGNMTQKQNKVVPPTKAKMPAKRPPDDQFNFGIDLSQIENLMIDEDEDEDDLDEDNEELLAEINQISTNPSLPSQAKKSRSPIPAPSIPPPDYLMTSQSTNISTSSKQKLNEQDMNTQSARLPSVISKHDGPNKSQTTVSHIRMEQNVEVAKTNEVKPAMSSDMIRLTSLRDEYRKAALNAKKNNDQKTALSHIKVSKQIEVLINALESGQEVDLSELPASPSLPTASNVVQMPSTSNSSAQVQPQVASNEELEIPPELQMNDEEAEKIFNAPPPPKTVVEALEQRIAKFKSTLDQAKSENNSSKVRRLGRIVKQYEAAIKHHKAGLPVEFDELPAPPGFGPIPTDFSKSEQKPQVVKPAAPQVTPKVVPNQVQSDESSKKQTPPNVPPAPPPKLKRQSSTANKQLNYLVERQAMFKEAALESKKKGDIQQAKEYLRAARGFDPLIEATRNGLPIDVTSIPTPPQITEDFVLVSHPEASDNVDDLEREEIYRKIEIELHNQIEMCKRNKEYFLQLGDVSTASKFEKYAIDSKKDCDMLIVRWRNGEKVPTFKYETRCFSVVICNTEVGTNEISVEVLKALDVPAKSDVDTYIKIEFPFPNDQHQTAKTHTIKNTINPTFNQTFKFEIDRKSRALPRVLKRYPLKLDLMSKGGFLRSDTLIGSAQVKMSDLETKCTIHDSFPLLDGRKVIGGKIEARVRIREPLLAKQVEEVKEKWLLFA